MLATEDVQWQRAEWLADAKTWIEESLEKNGLRANADLDQFHIRAWSTVICVPSNQGDIYFKAGGPNQTFEPALLNVLHQQFPENTLPVLAINGERGWVLLQDGGSTMRQGNEGLVSEKDWSRLLERYAEMQIELASKMDLLLEIGVPDRRISTLPSFFDLLLSEPELMLLGEEDGLSQEELQQLRLKKPKLIQLCEDLVVFNLPGSLDHGDLHDANVFLRGDEIIFFDWGDASVTHPFISLMIPLRVLADRLGFPDSDDKRLDWARQAYLEPWSAFAPMQELLAAWELAHHIGKFQRAISWHSVSSHYPREALGELKTSFPGWLQEFLYHGRPFSE